jgi:hypothetical protein
VTGAPAVIVGCDLVLNDGGLQRSNKLLAFAAAKPDISRLRTADCALKLCQRASFRRKPAACALERNGSGQLHSCSPDMSNRSS